MPRPPTAASTDLGPWLIPAAGAAALLASTAVWIGGAAASALHGAGFRLPAWSWVLVLTAARDGTATLWPGVPSALVWALSGAVFTAVAAPGAVGAAVRAARRPRSDDPCRSLAHRRDVAAHTGDAARRGAQRLRPSLRGVPARKLAEAEIGIVIGRLLRPAVTLFSSWEDTIVALMAPRSGKTTAVAVPAVLSAPGPVVATSNRADVWAATATLRAERTGERVWVFDPQSIAYAPQSWWWDPLRGLDTVEEAERLASHFVLTVDDERSKRDIWGPAAQELLTSLFLAARLTGGTVLDVYEWLSDESTPRPVQALRDSGHAALAASLVGMQGSPPETRGSVYFTARTAAKCLRNPQITAWVTPPVPDPYFAAAGELTEFDPETFPTTRQTLYLLSKDSGGSAGPLVAALTDRVMRAAVRDAERRGGRLDPPAVVVLDEAANICRIGDLPALYSHLGSRGVIPITILQSHAQGAGVWGQNGIKALLGAATVKIIGPGMDEAGFTEDLAKLVGDHDVTTASTSVSAGRYTRSRSARQQRILPAAAIRALPKGQALVLLTGIKPVLVRTLPWYHGPDAKAIAAAAAAAEQQITANARAGIPTGVLQ